MITPLLCQQPARLVVPSAADPTLGARLVAVLTSGALGGRGGAAFPTATKIGAALSSRGARRPQLIINACDGEPEVHKDEVLLGCSPGLVADGVALVAHAVKARDVVFAAHRGSATEAALRALIAREPLLAEASVLAVPARYVSSESSSLASLAAGGEARPLFRQVPLTSQGPAGRRVLVLNAETAAQVAILWSGEPAATRLVTVTGAVSSARVLEVLDDWTVGDIVNWAGGLAEAPRAVLVGGYGGSWVSWAEARNQTLTGLAAGGVPIGAGLISVLGQECPIAAVERVLTYLAGESAGQCGPCMFGLPAVPGDWRQLSSPRLAAAARVRLHRRLPVIAGRGACKHPDGAVRHAVSALQVFGDHLAGHIAGRCEAELDLVSAS
jgi:NADH:ubiquinone oxidoreductase subunit F (NADH-binding)